MRRFCVTQFRQDGSVKYRPCDDAAESGHNVGTSLGETITCERADFPARVAALFAAAAGVDAFDMRVGTDDIVNAYRQCPGRRPGFTAVALRNPAGECRFFFLRGLNFGLTASVNQFNRVPELIVAFLRRRCGVACTHYFDDYCVCEPSFAGLSGQELLALVHRRFGIPLAEDKHAAMGPSGIFLGIMHDLSRFRQAGLVFMRPKPGRAEAVGAMLRSIIDGGGASLAAASSARGKVHFLTTTIGYGSRAARSVLAAFGTAGAGRGAGGAGWGKRFFRLTPEWREAILFLLSILHLLPHRSIRLRDRAVGSAPSPVLLWTDAMWEDGGGGRGARGGVGGVAWIPADHPLGGGSGRFLFFAQQLSGADLLRYSFTRDHSMIGPLEAIAAAGAYTSMPDVFAGRDVLHFIDNTNALYGLAKGYSAAPDMVRVIRSFHIGNIIGQANVWFNYVASKANVADLPSRDALHEMADILRAHEPGFDLGAAQRMFVWPDLPSGPDVDAVWAATAAQMAPPEQGRRRRGGRRGQRGAPSSASSSS